MGNLYIYLSVIFNLTCISFFVDYAFYYIQRDQVVVLVCFALTIACLVLQRDKSRRQSRSLSFATYVRMSCLSATGKEVKAVFFLIRFLAAEMASSSYAFHEHVREQLLYFLLNRFENSYCTSGVLLHISRVGISLVLKSRVHTIGSIPCSGRIG